MLHLVLMTLGLVAGALTSNGRRAVVGLTALWLATALVFLVVARPSFPLVDTFGLLSTLVVGILSVAVGHSLRRRFAAVRLPFFRR
ncbi:MAG TPA: hypothetical protein VGR61_10210 [Candidatus Dormibacteraeota bacterium]|nr:hypothetical protein [Candidatus Dormibacteraeota bacterium]